MPTTGPVLHDASNWPLALRKRGDAANRMSTARYTHCTELSQVNSHVVMLMTLPVVLGLSNWLSYNADERVSAEQHD